MKYFNTFIKLAATLAWKHSISFSRLLVQKIKTFFHRLFAKLREKYMLSAFIGILSIMVLLIGLLMGFLTYKMKDLSNIEELNDYDLYEVPSILYDVNGTPFKEFSLYKRKITSFKKIPKTVINTLILAEDRSFYTHSGVNFFGIFRAMLINLLAGHIQQGGSTLTQQLSKLLFTDRQRNFTRKFKELFYAFQIEKKLTKEEILEKYLNKVYYANGVYGIGYAAEYYFDKNVSQLNYAESALLISIPPSPTYYNPLTHPMNIKARQQIVMNMLIQDKKISAEEAERQTSNMWEMIQTKLVNGDYYKNRQKSLDLAPYFSEYIRRQLYSEYGNKLYTNGYRIFTTLNLDLQQVAEKSIMSHLEIASKSFNDTSLYHYKAIRSQVVAENPAYPTITEFVSLASGLPLKFSLGNLEADIFKKITDQDIYGLQMALHTFGMNGISEMVHTIIQNKNDSGLETNELEAAFVSTEASTGRIVAMIGGSGFKTNNQINRVYQTQRQPGSTFKPFLYLAALNSGRFTPASTFEDKPIAFQLPEGDVWVPGNASKHYNGEITLRNALRKSLNIISIKLIQALGIPQAINFIAPFLELNKNRFRIDSSLALGTSELTPLEVNKGYAQIANGGKSVIPHAIIEIRDRYNQIIDTPEQKILKNVQKQLDDPRYNYTLISILQDVMRRGSGAPLAKAMNFQPNNIAGKTGTTSNMTDAWFSGFSPDITATVWIGFDQRTSLGTNAFGGVLAEPIWIEYMKEAIKHYPYREFEMPAGLIKVAIHQENGKLMPEQCLSSPLRFDEIFTKETLPTEYTTYCGKKSQEDLEKNAEQLDQTNIFASLHH